MSGAAPISSFTNCEGAPGENRINWDLIHAHEGGDALEGYVPYDTKKGAYIGRSGVTIAAGFDIGQHNIHDLKNMGLDYTLIEKLSWYTAPLILQDAASALAIRPLTITADEAFTIDKAAHSEALSRLAVAYDNAVGVGKFWTLNETLQTTLADMAFQMGTIEKYSSELWQDILNKDWRELSHDLRAQTEYTSRRNDEANWLDNAMNNGLLRQGSAC